MQRIHHDKILPTSDWTALQFNSLLIMDIFLDTIQQLSKGLMGMKLDMLLATYQRWDEVGLTELECACSPLIRENFSLNMQNPSWQVIV